MLDPTICPGCGADLPASDGILDRPLNASSECWQVHGEVLGFELNHPELVRRFHELLVDTYGAQHAGGTTPPIYVAYSVVGLHLALEHGAEGASVHAIHQRMGKPDASWPVLSRPVDDGSITVLDVAVAGARVDSIDGHAEAMQRWAAAVWRTWTPQHGLIAALASRWL